MKDFKGKVAVITGGASGIGFGIAQRCVQEGVKVVLSDIDKGNLAEAESKLKDAGGTVIGVQTDVSKRSDVEALAKKTMDTFGAVHLLFNNAGVGALFKSPWETSWNEWTWEIGVNLWGVIHGVKIFTPIMLSQNAEGHIINTSSGAGTSSFYYDSSYQTTKHAVVALTENLYIYLKKKKALVEASVLCPLAVNTNIMECERHKPDELKEDPTQPSSFVNQLTEGSKAYLKAGMTPLEVADHIFDAIKQGKFYIFPHPELKIQVQDRLERMLQELNPRDSIGLLPK